MINPVIVYEKENIRILQASEHVWHRRVLYHPPEGNLGCGAYIRRGCKLLAVDVPSNAQFLLMQQEAQQLFGQAIDAVLITHPHYDHWNGLPAAIDAGLPYYISRFGYEYLCADARYRAGGMGIDGCTALHIDGQPVELFTFEGTQHSPGDLFIHLPDEHTLITGDAVLRPRSAYMSGADWDNWMHVLLSLSQTPYRTIVPGHGDVRDAGLIKELLDHMINIRLAVHHHLAAMLPGQIAVDTPEHARQVADAIIKDPSNPFNSGLILPDADEALYHKMREHVVDYYRIATGRPTYAYVTLDFPPYDI